MFHNRYPFLKKKTFIGGQSMTTWIRTGQGNYKGIIMHEKCGRPDSNGFQLK